MLPLPFPLFLSFFPSLLSEELFATAADSYWDPPARRKAKRKADGDAITCCLILLFLTHPFLQRYLSTAGLRQLILQCNKGESIRCLI